MRSSTVPRPQHWISPVTLWRCRLVLVRYFAISLAAALASAATLDLGGNPRDPFASPAEARVFIFVRADCPITNRYAPEIRRLAEEFPAAQFWLIYPDPSETAANIQKHMVDFALPGQPLRDPQHEMVRRAHAETAPEAAVFDSKGALAYHGRIDDLWVSPGRARPMATVHDLEDAIAAVLAGKSPKVAETRAVGCSLADISAK